MKLEQALIGSHAIKKLLIDRSVELKMPFRYLCLDVGIKYNDFIKSYINSDAVKNASINDEQLQKMLLLLGVEIKIQAVIKSDYDSTKEQKRLATQWNEYSKEKRNLTGYRGGYKSLDGP